MNSKLTLTVLGLASAAAFAGAQIVDQEDLTNDSAMAAFFQTDLAQSFQQSVNDIDGAAIYLQGGFSDELQTTITIQLWDNLPNAAGNLLTQGSVTLTGDGQWANVAWADQAISAGSTYYLVFLSTDDTYTLSGDVTNGYPNGEVYANPGYNPFSTDDYTFQTFRAPSTPEPITCSLLGFGALMPFLRRRRASR
jgi:hypothetical protein